jgi:hypothetical protein
MRHWSKGDWVTRGLNTGPRKPAITERVPARKPIVPNRLSSTLSGNRCNSENPGYKNGAKAMGHVISCLRGSPQTAGPNPRYVVKAPLNSVASWVEIAIARRVSTVLARVGLSGNLTTYRLVTTTNTSMAIFGTTSK